MRSPRPSRLRQAMQNSAGHSLQRVLVYCLASLFLLIIAYNLLGTTTPLLNSTLRIEKTALNGDYEHLQTLKDLDSLENPNEENHSMRRREEMLKKLAGTYQMQPLRKYVWLDVEIDSVTVGTLAIELFMDVAPKTAENFRALVTGDVDESLHYKDNVCQRIIPGFVVQCGDITAGDGTGGMSIYGRNFEDEPSALGLRHTKYALSMANAGKDTNGSQFFIVVVDSLPHLDGKHAVFGKVIAGTEVVDMMENSKGSVVKLGAGGNL